MKRERLLELAGIITEDKYDIYGKYQAVKKFHQYGPFFTVQGVEIDENTGRNELYIFIDGDKTIKDLEGWLRKNNVPFDNIEQYEAETSYDEDDKVEEPQPIAVKVSHQSQTRR